MPRDIDTHVEYEHKRGKIEIEVSSICRLIVAYRSTPNSSIIIIIVVEFDILSLLKFNEENEERKKRRIEWFGQQQCI